MVQAMFGLNRLSFLIVLVWTPLPANAEREVHVVSLVNGRSEPGYVLAVPDTEIYVDRPGKSVTLALIARNPLQWNVSFSEGTLIERIVLGGNGLGETQVSLTGIPMDAARHPDFPVTTQTIGAPFRKLVADLTELAGVDAIQGFYGRYSAPNDPIILSSGLSPIEAFNRDYLSDAVGPLDDVPAEFLDWQSALADTKFVHFDTGGVQLDGETRFEVPADVPPILLPQVAVHDPVDGMIYAMSLGGSGYVYRIDTHTGDWAVLVDLNGFDGAQMFFDQAQQRLVLTGAFGRPGEIMVLGLNGMSETFTLPVQMFAGLTDIYDYGRDDPPSLIPLLANGEWVLMLARAPTDESYRVYALNLANRNIRLLAYHDAF
ncbi:hypothetical protein N9O61_02680 [Octadecabacter sp.]|nr:hypothetical protein [Octadecabacter sp.]